MTINRTSAPDDATHQNLKCGTFYKAMDGAAYYFSFDDEAWRTCGATAHDLDVAAHVIRIPLPTPTAIPQTAQEIERLRAENERLKVGHDRYEIVRKLNVVQFQALYTKALQSPIPFDKLVDMLGELK